MLARWIHCGSWAHFFAQHRVIVLRVTALHVPETIVYVDDADLVLQRITRGKSGDVQKECPTTNSRAWWLKYLVPATQM